MWSRTKNLSWSSSPSDRPCMTTDDVQGTGLHAIQGSIAENYAYRHHQIARRLSATLPAQQVTFTRPDANATSYPSYSHSHATSLYEKDTAVHLKLTSKYFALVLSPQSEKTSRTREWPPSCAPDTQPVGLQRPRSFSRLDEVPYAEG